jgi:hypothetical protein
MIIKARDKLGATIFFLYALPLFVICGISADLFSPERSFLLLGSGLLLTGLGALFFYRLMEKREDLMREESFTVTDVPSTRGQVPQETAPKEASLFQEALDKKNLEIEGFRGEKEKLVHRVDDILHEFQEYKKAAEQEAEHQKNLIRECQETIAEQRSIINRKQQQISDFESKVHDLNYEVKTLLKLADYGSGESNRETKSTKSQEPLSHMAPPFASAPGGQRGDTKEELKRCIDIAQKITGASPFGGGGLRFRELNIDNYALDLRRLCDALKGETTSPIIVWSQKENKLLFANAEIKTLLGWNPEQFVQDFRMIVHHSLHQWQDGISELQQERETELQLGMKNKSGQIIPIQCHLRTIPSGIFRSHAIGILQSA